MGKRILFITLSNIGDAILTLPALDRLQAEFPGSSITVLGSKRVEEVFLGNPYIAKFIVYDKKAGYQEKIRLSLALFKENFDQVIDLRDTFLGFILKVRKGIFPFRIPPKSLRHMKDRHLYRSGLKPGIDCPKNFFSINPGAQERIARLFSEAGISVKDKVITISAGARSNAKIFPPDKFLRLIPLLISEFQVKIILVGDSRDTDVCRYINRSLGSVCLDLSGKTSLKELACILKRSDLLISNDSAVMHMASYLDTPVVAIFGITDENKYGPWSKNSLVVRKEVYCRPCHKAECITKTKDCFNLIKVEELLRGVRKVLAGKGKEPINTRPAYKRILIIRTDRIGDLVLSTPFIKAIRQNYPHAFISMLVSPYSKDIVEGNPWLDEILAYDKDFKNKSWFSTLVFSWHLRKYKFDVAFILHPTNRVHLISWLAGIHERIGYDRKLSFLLTDKVIHRKHLGQKHELEYTMDFLRTIGIDSSERALFMPIKEEAEKWAEEFMIKNGIGSSDKLLLIHPAASCRSKIWPPERFSEVADRLSAQYGLKVLVVCGPKDLGLAESVINNMHTKAISLAGKTSVSQLASLLKRAALFISNDSGPVHVASALGTPVIAIFGRNQPGLSPKRWGPVGLKDKILHRDVGCVECLAHNCKKGFACLKTVTVNDVLSCADSILR